MLISVSTDQLVKVFLNNLRKMEANPSIAQMGQIEDIENPDFSAVKLEPGGDATLKTYQKSKPGSDGLNLSKAEFDSFHGCKTKDELETKFRQMLTDRFNDYRQKGLEGIGPYQRSRESYESGKELRLKTEKSEIVKKVSPAFYKYLLEYPNSKPDGLKGETYSWINFTIDGKPTLCLIHKMVYQEGDMVIFCQRHFYVSRGHNSVQGIGGAFKFESDADSSLVVYASRTSTDSSQRLWW
jgi:hypothetical protein